MFVSDRFVYLELHKTGCSHIRLLLEDLVGGEFVGKHNQAPSALFTPDRIFLGSVRNPWEWYCSLWSYGCDGRGAVRGKVTKERGLLGLGWRKDPVAAARKLMSPSHAKRWQETYRDVTDAGAFRAWLSMMHDPEFIPDYGQGFGERPLSKVCGLMTYRYLRLFCTKEEEDAGLDVLTTFEDVQAYEKSSCFVSHFIRNERLEADLFEGMDRFGTPVSPADKERITSKARTNTSSRTFGPAYYYDDASVALVADRERLLIDKFDYVFPDQ